MKTYQQFIEETGIANSMGGGGFSVGQAAQTGSPNLAGFDVPFGTIKRRKQKNESFAGCPVFTVSNDDYSKCMHGRMRYERWNKKLNMEEIDNQEIRAYAHRNPGKPIIVKDDRYGTMSYFIPPKQEVDESVELDENPAIGYLGIPFKSLAKAGVQAVANKGKEIVVNKAKEVAVDSAKHIGRSAWQGAKSFATSDTVKTAGIGAGTAIASRALEKESNTKKESVEVEEGKKTLRVQSGIGKSKHTVSFHDGKKKHKDGSPFYDIKIFKNKKDSEAFVQQLVKKGYRTESFKQFAESPLSQTFDKHDDSLSMAADVTKQRKQGKIKINPDKEGVGKYREIIKAFRKWKKRKKDRK